MCGVHSVHIWPCFLMQPWADIKEFAREKSNAVNTKYEFSQEDCFIGPYPDEHWLLHLFDTFLTPPRERLRGSTTPGHHEWMILSCASFPVFSINHIQYGLINLIGGQLLFPSAPVPDLGKLVGEWELVWKGMKGSVVVRAAALYPFPAWQRLPALCPLSQKPPH